MNVKELKSEGLKKSYAVVVAISDFEKKVEEKINQISKNTKIPGFRPGKAPKDMLRQKYRNSVMGEALDEVVRTTTDNLVKEKELKLAQHPDVKITKFDEKSDLEFEVEIEVMPEITFGDFSKISLEKIMAEVPEQEVEKAIGYIAQSRKETAKIEDANHKAQKGETLVIDFVGSVDGVEFEGGKGSDYSLELGSNTFIPGFEDQLIDAKAGDKIDVKVKFPEDYHAKNLAGKDSVFAVDVKEIRKATEIVVDDEFAKSIGEESLEALKESIKNRIKSDYENTSKMKLKRALLDKLDKEYSFEVPSCLVDEEFKNIQKQYEQAKAANQLDEHEKSISEEELMEEYKDIAIRRVKLGLLLSEVGQSAKISVSPDDVNKAIMAEARKYPGQEKAVFDYYLKNAEAVEAIKAPIFEEKIIDHVIGQTKVEEKIVSVEELYSFEEEKKEAKKKPASKKAKKEVA